MTRNIVVKATIINQRFILPAHVRPEIRRPLSEGTRTQVLCGNNPNKLCHRKEKTYTVPLWIAALQLNRWLRDACPVTPGD